MTNPTKEIKTHSPLLDAEREKLSPPSLKEKGVWIVYDLEANRKIQELLMKEKFAFRFDPSLKITFSSFAEEIKMELCQRPVKNKPCNICINCKTINYELDNLKFK